MYKKAITIEAGEADAMTMVLGGAIANALDAQGIHDLSFGARALPGAFVAIQASSAVSRTVRFFKTHFDTKDGGRRNTDGPQLKEVKRSGSMFMAFMFVFLAAFSLYYVLDM
jgi:hypothetical protein